MLYACFQHKQFTCLDHRIALACTSFGCLGLSLAQITDRGLIVLTLVACVMALVFVPLLKSCRNKSAFPSLLWGLDPCWSHCHGDCRQHSKVCASPHRNTSAEPCAEYPCADALLRQHDDGVDLAVCKLLDPGKAKL